MVVAACVLALAASFPARATHGKGCGGSWSGSRGCTFEFRGFPLTVTGEAFRDSGKARVHVTITIQNDSTGQVLLECEKRRSRSAKCSAAHEPPVAIDTMAREVVMLCVVEGAGSGTFRCESNDV